MSMPARITVPRYTLRDLESFPDDGYRYELLDGLLLVTPAPAPLHDVVVRRLVHRLTISLGDTAASVSSQGSVEVEPATHLEPDVLVLPPGEPEGGVGPDTRWTDYKRWWLAVEVSGKGSRVYDRDYKAPAYLALGVGEAWLIDLAERSAWVARRDDRTLRRTEMLTWRVPGREPVRIAIADLFEGTRET